LSNLHHLRLPPGAEQALRRAARWHDRGKAHPRGQEHIERDGAQAGLPPPPKLDALAFWAKTPDPPFSPLLLRPAPEEAEQTTRRLKAVFRPGLRHECASALAARRQWLDHADSGLTALAVYLVACHHGKVRVTLRPTPKPGGVRSGDEGGRNAFGVSEGDAPLPETDLGGETAA